MIEQIHLKGFQSHVNTVINLQNGLNVITGPSDAGKTSIIRAIRWVAFNEPQGEAFVNESVGEAEVKLLLQNGSIITKHRKSGRTSYIVQANENDEGSIFEKAEVPLEVTRLLGIEKHNFGDFETALNFSFQLDAPFLISETASAGAKVLGKLAGTESVDLAIKGVSRDTHAARNMRSQAEKDMERIIGNLFEYEHIDDAKQSLETAELIMEQVESDFERLNNLNDYNHQHQTVTDKLNTLFTKLDKLAHVPTLEEDLKDIERAQQRYDQLLQLYSDAGRLQDRISSLDQDLTNYKDISLAADLVNSITSDIDRLSNVNTLHQSYQKYSNDVRESDSVLEKTKNLDEIVKTLNDVTDNTNKHSTLRSLKNEYRNTCSTLDTLNTKLESFKDMHETDGILTAVESSEKRLAVLKELQMEHLLVDQSLDNSNLILRDAIKMEQISNDELQQAWDEAGGVCPLCEQAVCEHGNA